MDIFEAIASRRSVRHFHSDKPVPDEAIKKILDSAVMAPSSGNSQCWHFVVVRDQKLKRRLAIEAGHQKFIDEAPVAIVVFADLDRAEHHYGERGRKTYSLQDTAAAIENMFLTITALGFASCWVGAFDEALAAEILKMPKNYRALAILPIGVPAVAHGNVPPRRPMEDVVTYK